MKKTLIAGLALATGFGAALAQDVTMRLSHQLPPTHHIAKVIDQFALASIANSGRPPEACSRMAGVMVMASWMPCACFSASAARSPVPPGARLALRRGIQLAT